MTNNTVSIIAMVVLLAILAGLITCTAIKYKDNFDDVGGITRLNLLHGGVQPNIMKVIG